VNPSDVLTSVTVLDESLKAFGKRTAWEFPDLNTLAVAVVMRIYGRYGHEFVKELRLFECDSPVGRGRGEESIYPNRWQPRPRLKGAITDLRVSQLGSFEPNTHFII